MCLAPPQHDGRDVDRRTSHYNPTTFNHPNYDYCHSYTTFNHCNYNTNYDYHNSAT